MYLDLDKYPNAKPYYEIPITGTGLENETSRYFRKPFYIIFNLAVGGTFSENYDIKEITALNNGDAKMYIDYVRVYQLN
jgi:beta-glucanase (GH16 family)